MPDIRISKTKLSAIPKTYGKDFLFSCVVNEQFVVDGIHLIEFERKDGNLKTVFSYPSISANNRTIKYFHPVDSALDAAIRKAALETLTEHLKQGSEVCGQMSFL